MSARRDGRESAGRGPRRERGSGTVLTLGLVAVVLVLLAAISLLGRAQSARGAAQAAADLGALAAAQHLLDSSPSGFGPGPTAAACGVARQIAAANGASLTSCEVLDDGVVRVTTARPGGLGAAQATARAGPAPPDEGSG